MFSGRVTDCFEVPGKGLAVMLTDVTGEPTVGRIVEFLGGHLTIVGLVENSTDGKIVSTQSSLTGQKVAPSATILLDWPEGREAPRDVAGAHLAEVALL